MTGLPRKVNQLLSLSLDSFEHSNIAPKQILSREEVLSVLEVVWERNPMEVLQSLEEKAQCASLSQVHRAIHSNGDELAIKVKYPHIEEAIEQDLSSLGWIAKPFLTREENFPLQDLRDALERNLLQELDFNQEMENLRRFRQIHLFEEGLKLPSFLRPFCHSHVFVMSYLSSTELEVAAKQLDFTARQKLQETYLRVFVRSVLEHGYYHADPHPGNLGVSDDKLVFYDFGSMGELNPSQIQGLRHLFLSALGQRTSNLFDCFCSLGFDPELLSSLDSKLSLFVEILMEPLTSDTPYDLNQWDCFQRVQNLLGEDRWTFRKAAPADLFFLMKAFFGLFSFLKLMGPRIHLKQELLQLTRSLPITPLKSFGKEIPSLSDLSRFLKISVYEDGRQKVLLTLKRKALNDLEELIPREVMGELKSQGISIEKIREDSRDKSYAPGILFEAQYNQGKKKVKVWLE